MQMSKTIAVLEKEVGLWKARYEKASMTLMDTTEEVRKKGGHSLKLDTTLGRSIKFHSNSCKG